jgi:hypothetical protein
MLPDELGFDALIYCPKLFSTQLSPLVLKYKVANHNSLLLGYCLFVKIDIRKILVTNIESKSDQK